MHNKLGTWQFRRFEVTTTQREREGGREKKNDGGEERRGEEEGELYRLLCRDFPEEKKDSGCPGRPGRTTTENILNISASFPGPF